MPMNDGETDVFRPIGGRGDKIVFLLVRFMLIPVVARRIKMATPPCRDEGIIQGPRTAKMSEKIVTATGIHVNPVVT